MSPLGLVILIVLIVLLFGGGLPAFYTAAPWRPGYGGGPTVNLVLLALLVIVAILAFTGRI